MTDERIRSLANDSREGSRPCHRAAAGSLLPRVTIEQMPEVMHDPREGVTPQGMIRTGTSHDAIAPVYAQVLEAAVAALVGRPSLYVYGSVATGAAAVPVSDVDLLSVGISRPEAERISTDLSARFDHLCREVSVGPASWEDLEARSDEGYGLRVFLRHYCVHLAGADPADGFPGYRADARAARGFNGDIARHLERWRSELEDGADVSLLGTRIARKALLAVAGLISLRDATWSTDRRACAARWNELEPGIPVDALVAWLDDPPRERDAIRPVLHGPVAAIVRTFGSEVGFWSDEPSGCSA